MIVTDIQPVSIVEDKGFLEFVRVLDPKYCPPSRRTIMIDHLPQLYKSKQQLLMEELNGINDCCLTTDMWTSRATEGYITVTCHYIDKKNMELKSAVLNTRHVDVAHTSENLASCLREVSDEWKITSKVHCVISDSAANIKRAVMLCNWNHLSCFVHLLNLVVTDAIKEDHELTTLIQKIK